MPHKTSKSPKGTDQSLSPFFKVGQGGESVAMKSIPVVVYAPKYDNELREEYEVEITTNGKFRITTTKVSKKNVTDFVGEYDSYEEARDVMFDKFNQDFNRPSENAIRSMGRSPVERVWDETPDGRAVKASISMVEGTSNVEVVSYSPKVITLRIHKATPFILSVKDVHPKYFENINKMHRRRMARVASYRQRKKR